MSAKLNVLHFLENTVSMTLHAYPVTSSWEEGTGVTSPAVCTGQWCHLVRADGGVMWNSPGRDYDASTASSQVSIPALETENWDSFDVSNIVAKWVSGQAPNLSLLLKSDNEAQVNFNFTVLASNDYSPAPRVRPQRQVTYTDCSHAIPPTEAVSAPAPGSMVSGSTVTLSAAASSHGAVSKVQLFVDGTLVGTAGQASWQLTWNSATGGQRQPHHHRYCDRQRRQQRHLSRLDDHRRSAGWSTPQTIPASRQVSHGSNCQGSRHLFIHNFAQATVSKSGSGGLE